MRAEPAAAAPARTGALPARPHRPTAAPAGNGNNATDGNGAGAAEDQAADIDAIFAVDELGIVDAEEGGLGVENDAGGDDRTGQAAASDFVRAGDGAETKIAEPALDR